MLVRLFVNAALVYGMLFCVGCRPSINGNGYVSMALDDLLRNPKSFHGLNICTSGYATADEGVNVYASKNDIEINRRTKVLLLSFEANPNLKPRTLPRSGEIAFCGSVEVLHECWEELAPEIDGPNCVPYEKPVFLDVHRIEY